MSKLFPELPAIQRMMTASESMLSTVKWLVRFYHCYFV